MKSRVIFLAALLMLVSLQVPAGEIHQATQAGDIARVVALLDEDQSLVNQPGDDRFSYFPLHFAAAEGNLELTRLLLERGANVDGGDSDNSTPLGVAALGGHLAVVDELLAAGAVVWHRDRNGACPISFATSSGNWEVVQRLIEAGSDLFFRTPRGVTLPYMAARVGMTDFLTYLAEQGVDMEARTAWGETPLGGAARSGQVEALSALLELGANPNPQPEGEDSLVANCAWSGHLEVARVLLEAGVSIDETGFHGRTALTMAAGHDGEEFCRLLIEKGANVNHVKENGETALVRAADSGRLANVKMLLAAGAKTDLGKDIQNRQALEIAVTRGYGEIVEQLLAAGATPDTKMASLAAYYGNDGIAKDLKKAGADSGEKEIESRRLADLGDIEHGDAVLWFLGHSAWAVKTQKHFLIFDYFEDGPRASQPGLCNGYISPEEISSENVVVFASHEHGDHFDPVIFDWVDQVDDITYYLGLEPEEAPQYTLMTTRQVIEKDGLVVTPHFSTDAGLGMVVEVDGVVIHHPGDHANGADGLMPEFTDEIDFLADKGIRPDITFFAIRGCSLGQPDQVKQGVQYALEKMPPKAFLPMHAGMRGPDYLEFINEAQPLFPAIQMLAPNNGGDHFLYLDGKLSAPEGIWDDTASAGSPGCANPAKSSCGG